jgi:hypothetical protein
MPMLSLNVFYVELSRRQLTHTDILHEYQCVSIVYMTVECVKNITLFPKVFLWYPILHFRLHQKTFYAKCHQVLPFR